MRDAVVMIYHPNYLLDDFSQNQNDAILFAFLAINDERSLSLFLHFGST